VVLGDCPGFTKLNDNGLLLKTDGNKHLMYWADAYEQFVKMSDRFSGDRASRWEEHD